MPHPEKWRSGMGSTSTSGLRDADACCETFPCRRVGLALVLCSSGARLERQHHCLGMLEEMTRRGLRVPADLPVEEVTQPGTHRHRQVVFEPELVVRSSTQDTGEEADRR